MPTLLAYALLFTAAGAGFIFIHLMIGKLVRPKRPDAEKLTVYECGEPTVGSAWVQFDLRFYVVALLFVIFDVEMAFFFPWAVVFGKANTLAKVDLPADERIALTREMMPADAWLLPGQYRTGKENPPRQQEFERSVVEHDGPLRPRAEREDHPIPNLREGLPMTGKSLIGGTVAEKARDAAETFAWAAFLDILVFFGVLLVGFAYLWRRGDIDWVRSVAGQRPVISEQSPVISREAEPAVATR